MSMRTSRGLFSRISTLLDCSPPKSTAKELEGTSDGILYFVDTTYERLTQRQMDVFGNN